MENAHARDLCLTTYDGTSAEYFAHDSLLPSLQRAPFRHIVAGLTLHRPTLVGTILLHTM